MTPPCEIGKTYAFVPARGGSTRIPRKNLARVGGVPLVARSVRVAIDAGCESVVVSTDDDEIAQCAVSEGATIHCRRPEHADEHAQIEDAIGDWLSASPLRPQDVIVLLQPTTPFRRATTLRECIRLARACGSALTVTRAPEAFFAGTLEDYGLGYVEVSWRSSRAKRPRSQDLDAWVREDGCAWAFTHEHFRGTRSRMQRRSAAVLTEWIEAFEVDTPEELDRARLFAAAGYR